MSPDAIARAGNAQNRALIIGVREPNRDVGMGGGAATPGLSRSFGVIELDGRQVPYLVLGEVEPDAILDVFYGADRNGDPLLAP